MPKSFLNGLMLILQFGFLLVGLAPKAYAAEACQVVYSLEKAEKPPFRKGKTEYDTFRANANDFWAWSRGNAKAYLGQELLTEGVIAGDPHGMNFGDLYLSGQKTKITLVDLDDAGNGAFLVDFARLLLSIKMSPSELKSKEIWQAYLDGLNQKKPDDIPDFIQEVMDKTHEEWLAEQVDFIAKKTKNGKMDQVALGLHPLSKLNAKDLARAEQLLTKVGDVLPGAIVKDVAYKVKETGGSQGLLRVWVLIEQAGRQAIYEFKDMADPATGYFENQKEHKLRLQEVTKTFWGVEDPVEYKVVSIKGSNFWLRPRYKYGLKFKAEKMDSDKKIEKYDEWNEFVAYLLGRLHGKQASASGLREVLKKKDSDAIIEKIKVFTKAYRLHMDEQLHSN